MIDCSVTDATFEKHHRNLLLYGAEPGAAATGYQKGELARYPGIKPKKFDFLRCVVETYGNFKDRTVRFCKELRRKTLTIFYRKVIQLGSVNDSLTKMVLARFIAMKVQKWNANMILD